MNKIIFIVSLVTVVTGIVGFLIPTPLTAFLRILFLIAADILVIMLVAKIFFAGNRAVKNKRNSRKLKST